ncbi:hypothetical protein B0H63DRAFT_527108 [Podospora didyma]|uniref:Uncharacterized protein n=1 Tax=Podospora didyma TaxID=330526 RepID=A0AAE0N657_9PEZI|nr:hypothetical protein B0H63DRAFT_527108 [Podospora didyma]
MSAPLYPIGQLPVPRRNKDIHAFFGANWFPRFHRQVFGSAYVFSLVNSQLVRGRLGAVFFSFFSFDVKHVFISRALRLIYLFRASHATLLNFNLSFTIPPLSHVIQESLERLLLLHLIRQALPRFLPFVVLPAALVQYLAHIPILGIA